jgi:acyl-CoA synthetase (AMP-forming)/AMP-acid ligase II
MSSVSLTVPAILRRRAADSAAKTFFACEEERVSFELAERRSAALAKGLLAVGARKGTRVGIIYPNVPDFLTAFLGATRIGAVAIPLSTLSTPDELGWLLAHADVEILVSIDRYRSRDFQKILGATLPDLDLGGPQPFFSLKAPSLRRMFVGEGFGHIEWAVKTLLRMGEGVSDSMLGAVEADVCASDVAVVVHTSGSMSVPKGVVHTHGALLEHIGHLNRIRRLTPQDVLFSNSPFFWIGGLAYSLIGVLEAGACLVCSNSQSAADTLDLIERERPTLVTGFAQSVAHLTKDPSYSRRDFSSVRRGNMPAIMAYDVRPEDPELRHNLLGTTETGSVYLLDGYDGPLPEELRGSFGKPTPNFDVRIVDPATGTDTPIGEVGELRIRGPYVMDGYLGRERHEVFEPDGWYRTGDLARTNQDGFIFYKGRLGEMIKTAGANVSPSEVEKVLTAITGRRAHVLGIDDAERGQLVVAAVVTDDGVSMDEAALREQLKERLSSYKIPRRILFLREADIPMMSSGKLDRRKLAEIFRAA